MTTLPDPNTNTTLPPIALLVTAYNRQNLLERALESLRPELSLLDIIVVDDGSEPPIQLERMGDLPVHLIRLPRNAGVAAAANAGLEYIYARPYEFIARLDSDDIVVGPRFTRQLSFLREHPEIGVVGSNFNVNDCHGNKLSQSVRPRVDHAIRKAMHLGNVLYHSSLTMRAEVARRNGFYDTRYSVAEDYDFFWRMLTITKAANLPDILASYETGAADSLSVTRRLPMAINSLKIKLRHFSFLNIYAYMGLALSLLEITDMMKYTIRLRKAVMKKLLPE